MVMCLEPLLNGMFAPTDCSSHHSLIPIQCSKNENLNTKIPWITNPFSSVFIYKKRDERETERERRKKEERRETKEIKTEIRPSQIQTAIIFYRELRLRCSMWPRKDNDEIYRVNAYVITAIFEAKIISSLSSKTHLKFFSVFS
jgi:hypothetical protein